MIPPEQIESRIRSALPGATVAVRDMTGTGDHYEVQVTSTVFEGLGPIDRHRLVYAALQDVLGGPLHALSLRTRTPAETS